MMYNDDELRSLVDLYSLLSRVFGEEATVELLDELASLDFVAYCSGFRFFDGNVDGVSRIADILRKDDIDIRAMRVQFAKLFIGPNRVAAPPWGSVYLDGKSSVMGASTLRVREFYRSFGVEVQKKNAEPDDHIALELAFVSHLFARALASESDEEKVTFFDAARTFLGEFVDPWIGAFAEAVAVADATGFYHGFADLTLSTVHSLADDTPPFS